MIERCMSLAGMIGGLDSGRETGVLHKSAKFWRLHGSKT